MQSGPLRVDQVQHILERIRKDQRQLVNAHDRSPWRSAESRAEARQALVTMVETAQRIVERLAGAQDPELKLLHGKLLVETELASQTLKDPSLRRG